MEDRQSGEKVVGAGCRAVSRLPFQLATLLAAAASSLKHGSDLISRPQTGRRSESGLARATGVKERRARGCFARERERAIGGYPRRWGSSDMAARQSAVCLAGARAVPRVSVRLHVCDPQIFALYSRYLPRYIPEKFAVSLGATSPVARNFRGWLAVTRGFLVAASCLCRGLLSPGTACSITSPPAVLYTVFPVSSDRNVQPPFSSLDRPRVFCIARIAISLQPRGFQRLGLGSRRLGTLRTFISLSCLWFECEKWRRTFAVL